MAECYSSTAFSLPQQILIYRGACPQIDYCNSCAYGSGFADDIRTCKKDYEYKIANELSEQVQLPGGKLYFRFNFTSPQVIDRLPYHFMQILLRHRDCPREKGREWKPQSVVVLLQDMFHLCDAIR